MGIASAGAAGAAGQSGANQLGSASNSGTNGAQAFLDYMKETPAQKMEDAWLNAHGLTRQKLAEMSPAQQKAVMQQMTQDIEMQLKRQAENASQGKTALKS